jgi:hypothetical protein
MRGHMRRGRASRANSPGCCTGLIVLELLSTRAAHNRTNLPTIFIGGIEGIQKLRLCYGEHCATDTRTERKWR